MVGIYVYICKYVYTCLVGIRVAEWAAVTPTYVTDCCDCGCRCHFDFVLCANLAMPSLVLSCLVLPAFTSIAIAIFARNSSMSLPVSCRDWCWSPAFRQVLAPVPGCPVTLHLAAAETVARLTYHLQTFSHVELGDSLYAPSVIAPLAPP